MEWGRAKSILILAFLLLNLLLAYQLWMGKLETEKKTVSGMEFTQDIRQLMEQKNIRMAASLPKETPKLQEITVTFHQGYPAEERMLKQPVRSNRVLSEDGNSAVFSREIPKLQDYHLDTVESSGKVYVLHQTYRDLPMFEVNLKLFVSEGFITGFTQQNADVMAASEQKEQKVLSSVTAISSLVENNYLPADSVITDVQLGFHGQIFDSETQVLAPYWRISTKHGEVYYVHAITGAVAAPQKEK